MASLRLRTSGVPWAAGVVLFDVLADRRTVAGEVVGWAAVVLEPPETHEGAALWPLAAWAEVDDHLLDRLARVGLAKRWDKATLGELLSRELDDRKADLKPASIVKLQQIREKLEGFLDPQMPRRCIAVQ